MVKDFATHFDVTRDGQASFAADKLMTYSKGGTKSSAVALEVKGGDIVTCA